MDVITWSLAMTGGGGGTQAVRVLKALKIGKMMRIWRLRKLRSMSASVEKESHRQLMQIAGIAASYMVLSHWVACGLAFISDPTISPLGSLDQEMGRVYNGESWLEILDIATAHPFQKYIRAFYWATHTLCLLGDTGLQLRLPVEIAYGVCATWLGIAFMLNAISSISYLVTFVLCV